MNDKTQKNVDVKNTANVSDLEKEVAALEKKNKELEGKVEELAYIIDTVEDEKLNILNQLKRALADYQNLESNTQKRLNLMYLQSRKSLAEKLIPLVDDLTMAINAKEQIAFDEKSNAWANGVIGILNNLEKSLGDIGVKKYIPEKGSKFDSVLHEALTTIPSEEGGLVFDVIQPGYLLDEVVIRPARVVVTKK